MDRYWKANPATAAAIRKLMKGQDSVLRKATLMAKRLGADHKHIYLNDFAGVMRVRGFSFPDGVTPDPKLFVRLKRTAGWRPRARTALAIELRALTSDAMRQVMQLIGMDIWVHLSVREPGIARVGKTDVYLETPEDVKAKGCREITNLAYMKAVKN